MTHMPQPTTLNQLFFGAVDRYASKRAAVRFKRGDAWQDITHQQMARQVHHTAIGLKDLGIEAGDRVGILSGNRPEWALADFACLAARCVDVPIYTSLPPQQIAYILNDAGVRALFVENTEQFDKIAAIRDQTPSLEHVIVFDCDDAVAERGAASFRDLMLRGRAVEPSHPRYRDNALEATPDEVATLIYTSGTTGPPKGVMLTHRNFTSNVVSALSVLPIGPDDACLSLLPLSHSFERMAGHYTMFHAGVTISYAESIERVSQNLVEVRPTVVLSVPRLFEKIYARVLEAATSGGATKRRMFSWARRSADRWADLTLAGAPIPTGVRLKKRIADRLVFAKLRARTGGRIRFFVSGGAPLNPEIAKFFFAAGLPILEGYGLTETSPVIAVNTLDALRIGTVGRPLPGVEVQIAPDGEIVVRGPNVMPGYFNRPDATRDAIDPAGWFHTGDIGVLEDGFLRITDRKKDLIVTAGGKNIAPQAIENRVKVNPFVLNVVMVGDRRPYPILLIVPDVDALLKWAAARNLIVDRDRLLEQPDVVAKVETEAMGMLRDLASFEMPKKILLLDQDFSIESGELTPTLKVKRRVVEERYKDRIAAIYAS